MAPWVLGQTAFRRGGLLRPGAVALCTVLVVLIAWLWLVGTPYPAAHAAPRRDISIVSPQSYKVYQRDESGVATIIVRGLYRGRSAPIQARWAGGEWTTVVRRPRRGRFVAKLVGCPAGQGRLELRFADDRRVRARRYGIGVGDVFVIAGGSNASGWGEAEQLVTPPHAVYKAAVFGNDDHWRRCTDPTDSNAGQVDAVSREQRRARGSVWPLVAARIMATEGVPVAFIPAARGGSTLSQWQRSDDAPRDRGTLYGSMLRRVRRINGQVRAVLFWLGGTDVARRVPQSTAQALLDSLATDVRADLGVPVVVAQLGDWPCEVPGSASPDAFRMAVAHAWTHSDGVLVGPVLYDIDLLRQGLVDRKHYIMDPELVTVADRWWAALDGGLYARGDGRGPRVDSAVLTGDDGVLVRFADDELPLTLDAGSTAFSVTVDGRPAQVLQVVLSSADTVLLQMPSPVEGEVLVSLGRGRSGAGAAVPRDSSPQRLPAEPFVDLPASADGAE